MHIKLSRRTVLMVVIFAIFLLAIILRLRAAGLLSEEYDETIYVGVARDLAGFIRNFSLGSFISYNTNLEHPLFGKFLFSLALLAHDSLLSARLVSVIFGSLTVLLIAFRTPVGGFFLATEIFTIKYTSMAYLDPGAVFFALIAILMYERSRKKEIWFYLSAVAGGLAFATKYPSLFIIQIIPILTLADNSKNWRLAVRKIVIWLAIAAAVFMLVNPPFWQDSNLIHSLLFHGNFAGTISQEMNRPWWYVLSLMWNSTPDHLYQGIFLLDIEKIILVLGFLGLPLLLYRKKIMESLWFIFTLMFLLVWPVKWATYPMIFTPALAMSAGFLVEEVALMLYRSRKIYFTKIRAGFSNLQGKLRRKLDLDYKQEPQL